MTQSEATNTVTTVLVVDDHASVGEAIGMAVDLQDDLECVGVAPTLAGALDAVARQAPDVVLMDVRLPDADGIDGAGHVKALRPETRILVFTAHADLELMARAAAAGACGFLPKTTPVAKILEAIRTARDGGMLVEQSALSALVQRLRDTTPEPAQARLGADGSPLTPLTPREHEVLLLLGQGLDPSAIARRLHVSVNTCRGTVQSILRKLGAHSQLEAVVTALRTGLIPSPEPDVAVGK